MKVLDQHGAVLVLRNKLGEGGEGAVWESPTSPQLAIKTYLSPMPIAKFEKLLAMTALVNPAILSAAAWPKRVVFDEQRAPIGFEMPKLQGQKPLHDIFGTKSRQAALPNANWRMLVHAAYNLAGAFEGLHARGIVVGDINSNNVVIQADARVTFIDCDSFQISAPPEVFRCEVGVPDYQPPELQGVQFSSINRTPQHDAFGMAVMLFQLLFVGKHPFMGRAQNPKLDVSSHGANIARGFYFYDDEARKRGLQPPPASLSLAAISPELAHLFTRAFRSRPAERPTATEWREPLRRFEHSLVSCSINPAHRYMKNSACPWCAIEVQQRIVYFIAPALFTAAGDIDETVWSTYSDGEVARIWAEIAKIPPPNVRDTPITSQTASPRPLSAASKAALRRFYLIAVVVVVALADALYFFAFTTPYAVWVWIAAMIVVLNARPHGGSEYGERKARLASTKEAFERADAEWRALCKHTEWAKHVAVYADMKTSLDAQKSQREAAIAGAQQNAQQKTLDHYLDTCFISAAKLKGFGPSLQSNLVSFNIETALDIDNRVYQVYGIGEVKARRLFDFRKECERNFRLEPKLAETVVRTEKARFARERAQLGTSFAQGPTHLKQIATAIEQRAPEIYARAVRARAALDQAQADLRTYAGWAFRI
jgi:DNA-binding helix-hairpin-helix protein with protein kinase domain